MDKLKQHFEKGILAIAMLVMGYVAFTLYSDADEQQTKIQEQVEDRERGRGRKVSWEVDMSPYTSALAKLDNVQPLTLSNPHNLFNPVQWRKTPQGKVFKVEQGNEIGAGAISLDKTLPLYLKVEFRSVSKVGNITRYRFAVTREAAKRKKDRIRVTTSVDGLNVEDIRKIFRVVNIKGDTDNPTELTLRMVDGSGDITVLNGEVFSRVDGYTADLSYPPNGKFFKNKRAGEKLFFAEDAHNIVAINKAEAVLSTASTSKRTTIRLK